METVTTICVFLVICATRQTNAYSKPEVYNRGDNATVLIKKPPTNGIKSLEIVFFGFIKGLHVVHKLAHSWTKFEQCEQHTSRMLTGQVSKPMILSFMFNNTNTSSIKIGKSHAFDYDGYLIYDVARNNCTYTNVSQNLNNRIDSGVLNDTTFTLILRELTWQDKGAYTAWDDQGLLLDSLFVGSPANIISSPRGTHSPDSSSHKVENDNIISTPRGIFSTDSSCHREQNECEYVYYFEGKLIWLLVSAVVNVLLLSCLTISAVRKLRHWKGKKTKEEEINCSEPDQRMFQVTNTAFQSDDDDDEMKYEEPRSNGMDLTAYIEPISQPVNVYERHHPYENQGNNMYRFLRPEDII